ncbi:hypothetical protein FRC10_001806 [Ceratobasidium sp. 414]|nr:hypothetical protein FRC10_001806 [Ceratobasidium sp. 414]
MTELSLFTVSNLPLPLLPPTPAMWGTNTMSSFRSEEKKERKVAIKRAMGEEGATKRAKE